MDPILHTVRYDMYPDYIHSLVSCLVYLDVFLSDLSSGDIRDGHQYVSVCPHHVRVSVVVNDPSNGPDAPGDRT